MQHLIFVYGTLKQGFRNHPVNHGQRQAGDFLTAQRLPLYVIGPRCLPWLVEHPGQGEQVRGELYEVDDAGLACMDELEQIERPNWYRRAPIRLLRQDAPEQGELMAQVYFGAAERVGQETVHAGPLPEYTQALAARHAPPPAS